MLRRGRLQLTYISMCVYIKERTEERRLISEPAEITCCVVAGVIGWFAPVCVCVNRCVYSFISPIYKFRPTWDISTAEEQRVKLICRKITILRFNLRNCERLINLITYALRQKYKAKQSRAKICIVALFITKQTHTHIRTQSIAQRILTVNIWICMLSTNPKADSVKHCHFLYTILRAHSCNRSVALRGEKKLRFH